MTTWDGPDYEELEKKRLDYQDTFPDDLRLRARRFTSWLGRAEQEMKRCDYDAAFICYWIAFNAAYAEARVAREEQKGEREAFRKYFDMIIPLDTQNTIYRAIWRKFYGPIEDILNNEYVFQPFWDYYDGVPEKTPWETRFENERNKVHGSRKVKDIKYVLGILFDRLYVLRNQLVHGGATWVSSVTYHRQVTDGAMILAFLVPLFIELMMDNPDIPWPPPPFPLVPDSHERRQHSV